MKIAILGWNSLVTEPRGLPIVGGWQPDGPQLWLEFSRIARRSALKDGLTLVIDEKSNAEVTTYHALSQRTELVPAIADLQAREGKSSIGKIGYCEVATGRYCATASSRHARTCARILAWAQAKAYDAVIWTALAPRFEEVLGLPFSPDAALKYVNDLPAPTRAIALAYIHSAPAQIMTPFRRLVMEQSTEIRELGIPLVSHPVAAEKPITAWSALPLLKFFYRN